MSVRANVIRATVQNLVTDFLGMDRDGDELLPRGAVEAAIRAGEITAKEIVTEFAAQLASELPHLLSRKTLAEVLPAEFMGAEFSDIPARRLAAMPVVFEHDSRVHPWPGPERHVMHWYLLADGHIVGHNENPSRGWSFPVRRPKV